MARSSFIMHPTKSYINRYLLLMFLPPLAIMGLFLLLVEYHILDSSYLIAILFLGSAFVYLFISIIWFFAKKQHTLEIKNHAITVKSLFGNVITKIKVKQICSVRRNFLDELLLLDETGTVLLHVCPHWENRILFEEWLLDHELRC